MTRKDRRISIQVFKISYSRTRTLLVGDMRVAGFKLEPQDKLEHEFKVDVDTLRDAVEEWIQQQREEPCNG